MRSTTGRSWVSLDAGVPSERKSVATAREARRHLPPPPSRVPWWPPNVVRVLTERRSCWSGPSTAAVLGRQEGVRTAPRRHDERGLSLLEVTVAMALLASGVMATTSAIDASARAAGSGRYRTAATALAER